MQKNCHLTLEGVGEPHQAHHLLSDIRHIDSSQSHSSNSSPVQGEEPAPHHQGPSQQGLEESANLLGTFDVIICIRGFYT